MPALQRASRGYLRRHPWQLALALVGICIGVAVMVAVDLANASAQRAFRLSVEAVNGRATHQLVGGPDGVDEELYRTLRVAAGVERIAPVVSGSAALQQQTLTVLGVDPFAERDLRNYTAAGGATPTATPPTPALSYGVPGSRLSMSISATTSIGWTAWWSGSAAFSGVKAPS